MEADAVGAALAQAATAIFRRPPPKSVKATKLEPTTFVVVIALIGVGAILILAAIFNPLLLF